MKSNKKYTVNIDGILILAKFGESNNVQIYDHTIEYSENYIKELTEKEIKDFDERFWAFKEEVGSS